MKEDNTRHFIKCAFFKESVNNEFSNRDRYDSCGAIRFNERLKDEVKC